MSDKDDLDLLRVSISLEVVLAYRVMYSSLVSLISVCDPCIVLHVVCWIFSPLLVDVAVMRSSIAEVDFMCCNFYLVSLLTNSGKYLPVGGMVC